MPKLANKTIREVLTGHRKRAVHLLATTKQASAKQVELVKHYSAQTVELLNRDNRTSKKIKQQWLWYCKRTRTHYTYDQVKNRWRAHLDACGVSWLHLFVPRPRIL